MAISHSELIYITGIFDYFFNKKGMCFGIVCQAIESIFADPEAKTLGQRWQILSELTEEELKKIAEEPLKPLTAEEEKKLTPKEQIIRSLKIYFQTISLHFDPENYSDLFPKGKGMYQDLLLTTPHTSPKILTSRIDFLHLKDDLKDIDLSLFKHSYVMTEKNNKIFYIDIENVAHEIKMTPQEYKAMHGLVYSNPKILEEKGSITQKCFTVEQTEQINQILTKNGNRPLFQEISEIEKIDQVCGLYDNSDEKKHDLEIYYDVLEEALKKQADKIKVPVAFLLRSSNHAIAVIWSPQKKSWIFVDANSLPEKIIHETKSLASAVRNAFSKTNITTFSTEVYTLKNQAEVVKETMETCKKDPRWIKIHQVFKKQKKIDSWAASWLYIAARTGDIQVTQQLLQCEDIQVNQVTDKGNTALYIAAYNGRTDIVKLLLECNEIQINKANHLGATALCIAAQNGHTDIVKLLLERKEIQINQATNGGVTALGMAAKNGYVEIVKLLLNHKDIKVNHVSKAGHTALYIAAQQGNVSVIKELLQQPSINLQLPITASISLLLEIANKKNRSTELKKLFTEKKCDFVLNKLKEFNPLHAAVFMGHTEVVKMLLETNKYNVFQCTKNNIDALDLAKAMGHEKIHHLLIKQALYSDLEKIIKEHASEEDKETKIIISQFNYIIALLRSISINKTFDILTHSFQLLDILKQKSLADHQENTFFSFFKKDGWAKKIDKILDKYSDLRLGIMQSKNLTLAA